MDGLNAPQLGPAAGARRRFPARLALRFLGPRRSSMWGGLGCPLPERAPREKQPPSAPGFTEVPGGRRDAACSTAPCSPGALIKTER